MKTDYAVVETWSTKTGKCFCGKYRRRSKRFWQTLNPFNKNSKGEIKSLDEIQDEILLEAKTWRAEPIKCAECKESA